MVKNRIAIVWTNRAKNELRTIFNYYKEKSIQNAITLRDDSIVKIFSTKQNPRKELSKEFIRALFFILIGYKDIFAIPLKITIFAL
ncbi:hypothetical protein [Flavobacterium poyangense]|uniref:hypothetical protein n=1 Tax=Flavobacterium poyangense TaxID=2204302 RepID=UPI0014202616|nr:hypothetical protein [Flavobacterium sp. JXAS1]